MNKDKQMSAKLSRFYVNYVECKYFLDKLPFVCQLTGFMWTMWNVNNALRRRHKHLWRCFMWTMWNVNDASSITNRPLSFSFMWTMWNVNLSFDNSPLTFSSKFYVNYVECKSDNLSNTCPIVVLFYVNYVECK